MILPIILIGLLPGLFWLWFFWLKDREHPEPLKLLAAVFLLGASVAVPAALIELGADAMFHFSDSTQTGGILLGMLLVVAPVEEYLKYKVVKKFVYDKRRFDEEFDGMIYLIVAALGFASFENVLAVFSSGFDTLALRFLTATLLHALTAGVCGYFLGLAYFSRSRGRQKSLIAHGLIAAIVIHGVYNFILATETGLTVWLIPFVLLLIFVMVREGVILIKQGDRREKRE